jgi:hypothetical protein
MRIYTSLQRVPHVFLKTHDRCFSLAPWQLVSPLFMERFDLLRLLFSVVHDVFCCLGGDQWKVICICVFVFMFIEASDTI